jgi:hypothetical protein
MKDADMQNLPMNVMELVSIGYEDGMIVGKHKAMPHPSMNTTFDQRRPSFDSIKYQAAKYDGNSMIARRKKLTN